MSSSETSANPEPTPPADVAASGLDSLQAGLAPEIARRVSSIFDAVEREAESLRAEAREEARRYLEDAQRRADELVHRRQQRIGELSDELLHKAEAVVSRLDSAAPVRQGFESLVRALGGAAERLSREVADPGPSVPAPPIPDPGAGVPPTADPAPGPPPSPLVDPLGAALQPHPARAPSSSGLPPQFAGGGPEGWADPDAARLGAIELAAAGSTRAQVRARLEERTGHEAAAAILDQIFGSGGGEHDRVPWTVFPR